MVVKGTSYILRHKTGVNMECGKGKSKGKGKDHPRTDHEGPDGELRHSCTLSLTSALDVVSGQRHTPAALLPGKTRYPLYRRLGGSQALCGRVQKISPPTGIRSPDGPARSVSLYRLKCTSNTAKRFIMSFNPYPANVENTVSS